MSNFKFEFGRPERKEYSSDEIINELERVAKHFHYNHFCREDFDKIANIHSATVERHYQGSWTTAMQALQERLAFQNILFASSRRRNIPEKAMFDEMERIWVQIGHRPSRSDWTAAKPKVSYDSIYRYFGSWTTACLKFIEFKSGETIAVKDEVAVKEISKAKLIDSIHDKKFRKNIVKARSVSLNIRIKVLSRDNFRCVLCGKSPATDLGAKLHVDHIIPFSKGGTNTLENLQTLCEQCNLGKSNLLGLRNENPESTV